MLNELEIVTVSKISLFKLARVMMPSVIFCFAGAYFILMGMLSPHYQIINSRSAFAGLFAIFLCSSIGLFYFTSIIIAISRQLRGIYIEDGRLHFYNIFYKSVDISDINDVDIDRSHFFPRVSLKTSSRSYIVMSQVMEKRSEEISNDIAKALRFSPKPTA